VPNQFKEKTASKLDEKWMKNKKVTDLKFSPFMSKTVIVT